MRKTGYIIFLLFFFHTSITAQSDSLQKGWAITFSGALIPISQPGLGIQPGAEYRFNEKLSLLAEIAIPVNKKDSKDSTELNKKYWRVKSELRFSLPGKSKRSHVYTGLQFASSSRKFINQDGLYFDDRKSDSGYYYSKASINSPVTTVSLQIGTILSFSNARLALDFFAGIGARFINTRINDVVN
ncbi:MAG: hypothetical protein ACRDEB_06650, partial [Chitinophagaceae bacterium]